MEKAQSFLKLILSLKSHNKTGVLLLKKDQIDKKIYFKSGNIIFIDSTLRSENLGRILVETGKLTQEQFEQVVKKVSESGKRQGEVLVELGFLTPYDVFEALKDQLAKKLLNCFILFDFEYEFIGGENHLENITEIEINDLRCIIDGVQTSYTYDVLKEEGGFTKEMIPFVDKKKTNLLNTIKLKPEEVKLLRMLDGTDTLFNIAKNSGMEPEFVLSTVFVLNALGVIDYIAHTIKKPHPKPVQRVVKETTSKEELKEEGKKEQKKEEKPQETPSQEETPNAPITEKQKDGGSDLYNLYLQMDKLGYLELFRLSVHFKKEDLKRNYDELIKKYKLDRIDTTYEGEEKNMAEKIMNKVVTAFTVLKDEKKKDEYLRIRAKIQKPKEEGEDKLLLAEIEMNKAMMFKRKNNFAKAEEFIRKAIEYNEKEIEYMLNLAEVLLAANAESKEFPKEIEELLKKSNSIDQNNYKVFLLLGTYYKAIDETEKAINCFHKTLDLNPNNQRANMELRLFNIRKEEKPLFSFFSKKPKKAKAKEKDKDKGDGEEEN